MSVASSVEREEQRVREKEARSRELSESEQVAGGRRTLLRGPDDQVEHIRDRRLRVEAHASVLLEQAV